MVNFLLWRKKLLLGFLLALPLIFNPITGEVEAAKVIVLSVVSAVLWLTQTSLNLKNRSLLLGLGLFVIVVMLSTFLAQDTLLALWGSSHRFFGAFVWLMAIGLAISSAELLKEKSIKLDLLKTLSFSGVLTAFVALLLQARLADRLIGTTGNPNILGKYLLFTIVISLGLFLLEKKNRSFWLLGSIFQFVVLVQTGNRASLLVLILFLLFLLFKNLKTTFVKSFIGLLGLGGVVVAMISMNWERISDIETIATRSKLYEASLEAIAKSPFFGHGFDHANFVLNLPDFPLAPDRAHQFFLDAALNTGVIGMILLGFITVYSLIILLKSKEDSLRIYGFALLALLLSTQVSFLTVITLVLLFIGVGLALSQKAKLDLTPKPWYNIMIIHNKYKNGQ